MTETPKPADTSTPAPSPSPSGKADTAVTADIGENEVQAQVDEENARGFRGTRTDPTPLENYTVQGVVAGKPTPETDEKAAARAAQL